MSEKKAFLLRIDAALYAALAKWASDELRSQVAFYDQVYRPRRDILAGRWNERASKP